MLTIDPLGTVGPDIRHCDWYYATQREDWCNRQKARPRSHFHLNLSLFSAISMVVLPSHRFFHVEWLDFHSRLLFLLNSLPTFLARSCTSWPVCLEGCNKRHCCVDHSTCVSLSPGQRSSSSPCLHAWVSFGPKGLQPSTRPFGC